MKLLLSLFLTPLLLVAAPEDISDYLAELKPDSFPSLAAAVIKDGELFAHGATGVRKAGGDSVVTINDKYHIGSCGKSMTATLAAKLVEEKIVSWDDTLGETFPNWEMHEGYKEATLFHLLSHSAGFPKGNHSDDWSLAWDLQEGDQSPMLQRIEFAKTCLLRDPVFEVGSGYEYSNTGYTLAGLILEKATRQSWEELIQEYLFDPLEMNDSGFGPGATIGNPDQPWAHRNPETPVAPGDRDDNPDAIAPSGKVHCSTLDLANYVRMHLLRETGPVLEEASSFEKLQTGAVDMGKGTQYALGWLTMKRGWGKGEVLNHNGSNTMNYTSVWMAPNTKFAVLVNTNIGNSDAAVAVDDIIWKLIQKYALGK